MTSLRRLSLFCGLLLVLLLPILFGQVTATSLVKLDLSPGGALVLVRR